LNVVDIHDEPTLSAQLLMRTPDLILVESGLSWSEPISLIRHFSGLFSAPVVVICDAESKRRQADVLKRAYAAGACDTLFAPLESRELGETLSILLQFQAHASQP
jgi:response regulator of citrate/malate metabolism